jgi:hypothetical protein
LPASRAMGLLTPWTSGESAFNSLKSAHDGVACVLLVQEEEIRECTFKPETTPVPAYITEMAEVGWVQPCLLHACSAQPDADILHEMMQPA